MSKSVLVALAVLFVAIYLGISTESQMTLLPQTQQTPMPSHWVDGQC